MKVIRVKNYEKMSKEACQIVVHYMNTIPFPVLGLATGSTPVLLYKFLINEQYKSQVSFTNTTTFNLDEYVGLEPNHPNSYHYFMNHKLFQHVDIPNENIYLPNGNAKDLITECKNYDSLIDEANGIGLQVLGLGINGHIGFNEPGTSFNKRTHIVELDETTREANARFFNGKNNVPIHAITMGIQTILESKEILLHVSGESKALPLKRLLSGDVSEAFPASLLHHHKNVTIIADEQALPTVPAISIGFI